MKREKKIFEKIQWMLLGGFFLILIVLFCFEYKRIEAIFNSGEEKIEIVEKEEVSFSSPYTYGQENSDGTYSLFIYSLPIQYEEDGEYKIIGTSLGESEDDRYIYQNKENSVIVYFPENLISGIKILDKESDDYLEVFFGESSEGIYTEFQTMYGDEVEAVCYEVEGKKIFCYVSRNGLRFEVLDNKEETFSFSVKSIHENLQYKKNGYAELKKEWFDGEEYTFGMISSPIVKKDEGLLFAEYSNVSVEEKDGCFNHTFHIFDQESENAERMSIAVEIKKEGIADSAVYSKKQNSYLAPYSVIGKHRQKGKGMIYQRCRINYLFDLKAEEVIEAKYHYYVLDKSSENIDLKLFVPKDMWSSTQINWSNKAEVSEEMIAKGEYDSEGNVVFDVTDYVKECIKDKTDLSEQKGIVITTDNSGYVILGTSDNALYTPFLEIKVTSKPKDFIYPGTINP